MDLKNKIESLCDLPTNDKEVLNKISEIKGLYTAYELAPNEVIFNKIVETLFDVIEIQNKKMISIVQQVNPNSVNVSGELSDFYMYLTNCGKKHNTADNYRKIIMQVVRAKKYAGGIPELDRRIDETIAFYDGNDAASHNVHTAALRAYKKYLEQKSK